MKLKLLALIPLLLPLFQCELMAENIDAPGNNFNQPIIEAPDSKVLSVDVSSGYDSRYMFRGVNVLPNAGIIWAGVAPTWNITPDDSITVPFWYATALGRTSGGVNHNYREFDVPVNYTRTIGNLSLGAGYLLYTYFNLDGAKPGGTAVQNELELNAAYTLKTGDISWVPSLSWYYELGTPSGYSYGSINPGSSFLSPQLTVNVPIYKDVITFNPATQYNFTFGYNPNQEGHYVWGGNNWQITAPVTWQINKTISVSGYAAYSYQWQTLQGTTPGTFWGGGNVTLSF